MSRSPLALLVGAALLGPGLPAHDAVADAVKPAATTSADPHVWLEDVAGDKSLDWVRARNAESHKQLEGDLAFASLQKDLLAILDSDEKER